MIYLICIIYLFDPRRLCYLLKICNLILHFCSPSVNQWRYWFFWYKEINMSFTSYCTDDSKFKIKIFYSHKHYSEIEEYSSVCIGVTLVCLHYCCWICITRYVCGKHVIYISCVKQLFSWLYSTIVIHFCNVNSYVFNFSIECSLETLLWV